MVDWNKNWTVRWLLVAAIAVWLAGCGGNPKKTEKMPTSALMGSSLPATKGNPRTLLLGQWQQVAFITPAGKEIEVDDGEDGSSNRRWEFTDDGHLIAFGEAYRYKIEDNRLFTQPVQTERNAAFEFSFFVSQTELVAATDEVTLRFARLNASN